jgi:hypothetical protein
MPIRVWSQTIDYKVHWWKPLPHLNCIYIPMESCQRHQRPILSVGRGVGNRMRGVGEGELGRNFSESPFVCTLFIYDLYGTGSASSNDQNRHVLGYAVI